MNISSLDFNLFQSILLDYYKFSILFNKYNIFISLLLNSKKSIQQTQQYTTNQVQSLYNEQVDQAFNDIEVLS